MGAARTTLWLPRTPWREAVSMWRCRHQGVNRLPTPSISQHLPNRRTDKAAVQTGLCTWPQPQRGQGSGCLLCSPPPTGSHAGRAFPCSPPLGMRPPPLSVPPLLSRRFLTDVSETRPVLAQGSGQGGGGLRELVTEMADQLGHGHHELWGMLHDTHSAKSRNCMARSLGTW